MADLNYDSYNFKEEGKFWGAPQQITWHIDRFRDMHQEKMEEQTAMIEEKFNDLIQNLTDIFTGKKENTGEDESFYNMVQRENSETQKAIDDYRSMRKSESDESQNIFSAHSQMMQNEMDDTQQALYEQTRQVYGAISANTNSTKGAIENQTRTLTGTTYNVRGIL